MSIIAFQPHLRPVVPTVEGCLEYNRFREELERIDSLLVQSGVESACMKKIVARLESSAGTVGISHQMGRSKRSVTILRCMVLQALLGEDFRGMSRRLAECALFRDFCRLEHLGPLRVPSKSTLQGYSQVLPATEVASLVTTLIQAAGSGKSRLELANDVELTTAWVDSTCVMTNIHYPVDWVLLRDATRTLTKAVALIRKHGLKSRMSSPGEFMQDINRLCIKMSHSRRKVAGKKRQKEILRAMKQVVKKVAAHAQRHRDLLEKEWQLTDWSRKQAEQVLQRIDTVLEQLPAAQRQAHERIIGERAVANKDKILSLYERDTQVIVRGKAGAEVEFGNTLLLAEQSNGLIVYWQLYKDMAPADATLVSHTVENVEAVTGKSLVALGADRGFDSKKVSQFLAQRNIANGICPRNPTQLAERIKDPEFKAIQKRRSGTEARISILKHAFFGTRLRAKGFEHREVAIAWRILSHNLWVLARIPRATDGVQSITLAA